MAGCLHVISVGNRLREHCAPRERQVRLLVDSRLLIFNLDLETRQQTATYGIAATDPSSLIPIAACSLDQDTVRADSGSWLEAHEQLVGVVAMSEQ
jgi:hypothetical protein